jgi:hypothetical protein
MKKNEDATTGSCVNPACDMYEQEVPIEGEPPHRCPMCRGPLKPKDPPFRAPKES